MAILQVPVGGQLGDTYRTGDPKTQRHKYSGEWGQGKTGAGSRIGRKSIDGRIKPLPLSHPISQATTPVFTLTSPAGKQSLVLDMRHEGVEAQD